MSRRPMMGETVSLRALIIRAGHVLLLQRAAERSNPGRWEFPGGKAEFNSTNTTFESELRREVMEETGYELRLGKWLGHRSAKETVGRRRRAVETLVLYWPARILKNNLQLDSTEHTAACWATYDAALALDLTQATREALVQYRTTLFKEYKLKKSPIQTR